MQKPISAQEARRRVNLKRTLRLRGYRPFFLTTLSTSLLSELVLLNDVQTNTFKKELGI
jgi:hypothetical protein